MSVVSRKGDSWMVRMQPVTSDGFLFQVREQLGEITMRGQREQNGPTQAHPSQVRVQKVTGHPSLPVREYWTLTRSQTENNINFFWLKKVIFK